MRSPDLPNFRGTLRHGPVRHHFTQKGQFGPNAATLAIILAQHPGPSSWPIQLPQAVVKEADRSDSPAGGAAERHMASRRGGFKPHQEALTSGPRRLIIAPAAETPWSFRL